MLVALMLSLALVLPSPSPLQPAARYASTVDTIDLLQAASMIGTTWEPGCPVHLGDLRLITLRHWGYDGRIHQGKIVVHRAVASQINRVFRTLFIAKFPIRRMRLADAYGGDDDRATKANDTSGFNCRAVTGGTRWSRHSYGLAIDVNPVQNPYVYSDGSVLDPAAAPYVDRTRRHAGMIKPGDVVVRAFAAIGWRWGGDFATTKDYQHFDLDPARLGLRTTRPG